MTRTERNQEQVNNLIAELIEDGMTKKEATQLAAVMFNTCTSYDVSLFE